MEINVVIIEKTPHHSRHTCISLLEEAGVDQTIIKKIDGHLGPCL